MKVALLVPASPFLIRQDVMSPLGTWYISEVLKQAGHKVDIFDLGLMDPILSGYDVYGVTGASAQVGQIERIAYHLKKRSAFKVIGGPHATLKPQEMLDLGFDAVVCGEGEEVIGDILTERRCGVTVAKRIKNIDMLFPDRSQQNRYHYEINGLPATTMMTSRGCPYNCAFCSKDVWGRKYVARSVESVAAELDVVAKDYRAIMFYDDTFMIGQERLAKICSSLRHLGITWRAFARSDEATFESLRMMYESGCKELGVGIESGSQTILDNINKRETVEDHRRCIQWAHEVGLRVKGFIIVGLPGETWQTVFETDRFLKEIQLDDVDISILTVYAGSDIYKNPDKYDIEFGRPSFYKGKPGEYQCHVSTSRMSGSEIKKARDLLHKRHKKG